MLQYVIAFIVIIVFLCVFFMKPTVEVYIKYTLWTLPFTDAKILPLEFGFVKVFDVLALIAVIFLFKNFLTFKNGKTNMGYLVLVLLFVVTTIVGKIFSKFPANNIHTLYPLFSVFIFTRFFIHLLYEDFQRRFELFKILKIVFLFLIGIMCLQFFLGPSLSYYTAVHSNASGESFGTTRFPGLFVDSQTNGQFLAMASFFFLIIQTVKDKIEMKKSFLFFALAAICVVLAGSRSALGGFLIGFTLYFLFTDFKTKVIIGFVGMFAIGTLLIAQPNAAIFGRTENVGEDFSFREAIWIETIEIIEEYPSLGIGIGNFKKYIMIYNQDMNIVLEPGVDYYYFNQPENGYLKIIVEHGVLASIVLILLILIPFIKSLYGLLKLSINKEVVYVLSSLVSFLIAFNTVYSLVDYRITCLLGILVSMAILYTNSAKPKFL